MKDRIAIGLTALIAVLAALSLHSLGERVAALEGEYRALCAELGDHHRECGRLREDVDRTRFAVKAIANSLKFTEGR